MCIYYSSLYNLSTNDFVNLIAWYEHHLSHKLMDESIWITIKHSLPLSWIFLARFIPCPMITFIRLALAPSSWMFRPLMLYWLWFCHRIIACIWWVLFLPEFIYVWVYKTDHSSRLVFWTSSMILPLRTVNPQFTFFHLCKCQQV